eukprot:m.457964 g.457964  ORF g.457964 m.457964 type:complete len:78 (+) comp21579_c0_seq52:1159-1392(+)
MVSRTTSCVGRYLQYAARHLLAFLESKERYADKMHAIVPQKEHRKVPPELDLSLVTGIGSLPCKVRRVHTRAASDAP